MTSEYSEWSPWELFLQCSKIASIKLENAALENALEVGYRDPLDPWMGTASNEEDLQDLSPRLSTLSQRPNRGRSTPDTSRGLEGRVWEDTCRKTITKRPSNRFLYTKLTRWMNRTESICFDKHSMGLQDMPISWGD